MNAIVSGKHARRTSFGKPKPSSLWEWTNVTNYNHYVIFNFFLGLFFLTASPHHVIPCNFRLLFCSSIYSVYSCFFPNKPDEDWYWPVEILYTLAFFTLFDQSLLKSFWLWFYERNFQRQFRAGEWQKTAKENAVVKNCDELGRVKGGGTGGGSGAW